MRAAWVCWLGVLALTSLPTQAETPPPSPEPASAAPAPGDVAPPAQPVPAPAPNTEAPAPASPPGTPEAVPPAAPAAEAMPSSLSDDVSRRVNIGAFADLGYAVTKSGANKDFQIGQLVLHGTADLPRGFALFTEVTVNSTPTWETRVERILISWEYSDALKLTLGRHHLPVTWWNSTFHHGLWLQTTIRRPLMIGYSDAFIPNHAVGLVAEGLLPVLRPLGVRYHLALTGGGDDHKHTVAGANEHGRLAGTAALYFEPPSLPLLRLGAVVYADPQRMRNNERISETIVGTHAIWTGERPEIAAEWVVVQHRRSGQAAPFVSQSAYVQGAWRLRGRFEPVKVYTRWDRMRIDAADPSLSGSVSQDLLTGGLRWDAIEMLALRLEAARRAPVGAPVTWELLTQVSATW